MGAGPIHAVLLGYFYALLIEKTEKNKYWILSGKTGLKIEKKNVFSQDVAVYSKEKLNGNAIGADNLATAPELVIKINVPVEGSQVIEEEHLFVKIQRLHQFGVQKIIWVFSRTKMVMIAEAGMPWQMYPWPTDLTLIDAIAFNLDAYCREAGLQI